jgi:hypothetical protein
LLDVSTDSLASGPRYLLLKSHVSNREPSDASAPKDSIWYGLALGCGAQLLVLTLTGVLFDKLDDWFRIDFGWCIYLAWITQWLALGPLIRVKRREKNFRTAQALLVAGGFLILATLMIWAFATDLTP